jgi:hypothetical protein
VAPFIDQDLGVGIYNMMLACRLRCVFEIFSTSIWSWAVVLFRGQCGQKVRRALASEWGNDWSVVSSLDGENA